MRNDMASEDEGAEAWACPPMRYLRERIPGYEGERLFSCYVATRDATRLAVDVHLPGREPEEQAYPAILLFTPYYRRFQLREGHKPETEASPNIAIFRDCFVPRGYALVAVDIRGCGASFGSRDGFRSPRERIDHYDIADWVVAQPWCNGRLGATGISYVGAAADFLATTGHPAVKAVAPCFSVWDTWSNHLYPGGLLCNFIAKDYGALADALDHDKREALRNYAYFADPDLAGPAPVDEDSDGALLAAALTQHRANFDMQDFVQQLRTRDAGPSDRPETTSASISPYGYASREAERSCAVYGISGWFDGGGFSKGAIQRHLWLTNPGKRLLLGPWDHGARSNASPWRREAVPRLPFLGEVLRFFDLHLMGLEAGLSDEKPVHYFTLAEERWKAAEVWPPEAEQRDLFLAADGRLSPEPPSEAEAFDRTQADFDCRSGRDTRYDRLTVRNVTRYYADWHGRDAKMLCYTGAALDRDSELTGHPLARLHFACSERDCAFFLYLEDVTPEGRCLYVTEGVFRALHRKEGSEPPAIPALGPPHSFRAEDCRLLEPGEPAELSFDLLPTSYLFRRGHRIRLAIAFADSDHFSRIPDGRPPLVTLFRDLDRASRLTLPIVPRS